MSKYVNVKVSAIVCTDFYIEVPDNASEEEIRELSKQEVVLPHEYPTVIDNAVRKMGIIVRGLDSMLRAWDVEDINYIVDDPNIFYNGGNLKATEGE